MIDESAHKVFDYGMKDWHDFRTHKCSHCSRQLDIYYCESRLYLVRCKHCKIVSLVEAGNPNEAAEKVSRRAEPENKIFTVKQLKQMSGDPVWIKKLTCPELSHWIIVGGYDKNSIFSTAGGEYPITFYAKTWLPYARKPEGSETP